MAITTLPRWSRRLFPQPSIANALVLELTAHLQNAFIESCSLYPSQVLEPIPRATSGTRGSFLLLFEDPVLVTQDPTIFLSLSCALRYRERSSIISDPVK